MTKYEGDENMKIKSSWLKGFICGLLITCVCTTGAAFASGRMSAVTAYMDDMLHMTYNGAAFKPAEADGTATPVILYNDRTYLPVRAISEKAGVYVDYDDATAEVILKNENTLLSRANLALHYIKYRDFNQLAEIVHKDKGVKFAPYANLEDKHVTLSRAQLRAAKPEDKYLWGYYDGSGFPMNETIEDFISWGIYKTDFIQAPQIGINTIIKYGNIVPNIEEAFPGASFVEYHVPYLEEEYAGMDWQSVRLVFDDVGGEWMLVGIMHDCWTI